MIANTENSAIQNGHALNGSRNVAPVNVNGLPRVSEPRFHEPVCIRPYRPADRKSICQLCCDTGFLGRPADSLFQDRDLFADLFTRPYLDHESEWGIVAESEGKVVGYLLGSVRRDFELVQYFTGLRTASRMALRLATGRYAHHPRSRFFVRWLFTAARGEQPKHPVDAAHLHLDIHQDYRGRGVGRRMWETYERRLRGARVNKCYGLFFSHRTRRPEIAYARYGFTVFDRRRTTFFEPEVSDPVEVVCVSKNL